jgi:hypothetical protein
VGNVSRALVAFALIAAAAAAIVLGDGRSGPAAPKYPKTVDHLRNFDEFALFYPGQAVEGYPLEAVLRNKYTVVNNVTFIYGKCDPGPGEGGCAPPLQVQVSSACVRNFGMYGGSPLSPVPDLFTVRGVPASYFENGYRLELQTADSTVVIFSTDALRVAQKLRGINNGVQPGRPLPKPEPGALNGRHDCSDEAAAVREIRARLRDNPFRRGRAGDKQRP